MLVSLINQPFSLSPTHLNDDDMGIRFTVLITTMN